MSEIRKFRVNGFDTDSNSTEFYFKVDQDNGLLLCTFCIADDGLYYYRARSKILSPKENANARETFDGFISMEDLKDLFEMLRKAKLVFQSEREKFKLSRQGRKVNIEEAEVDDEE